MEKLVLKCNLSPGDIVMLTAAVRDLHLTYPGRFLTDVRTSSAELWQFNPYITPLSEGDSDVRVIDCRYPLINEANTKPRHCLEGFVQFLGDELKAPFEISTFKGDIHLSKQERMWYSQVQELTASDTPFWIIDAGGKYDVTIKWWSTERYQAVVDHFRHKILFVQIGLQGHHHPRLERVIDLRGRTSLRMLVRLVYHAQGIVCPVTCLMHLAAAVESKPGGPAIRPCVVVAGGREPAHWEQYPGHQFIHTIGTLNCCATGGCWKDRTLPIGDGDLRDSPDRLCDDVVNHLPRCMSLVSPQDVIRAVSRYFDAGLIGYLSETAQTEAIRGMEQSQNNPFERLSLTRANARIEYERIVQSLADHDGKSKGRGIIIAAGGCRYFVGAWVTINMLRQLGCRLPIEVWHLGETELNAEMAQMLEPLGVRCVDALVLRRTHPCRILNGWELKCYALLHSEFEEMLYLDADNVPVANPERLFETTEYLNSGAVFWPDMSIFEKTQIAWDLLGVRRPATPEFESGQMLVDKRRTWRALHLAMWLNENSDFFYRYLHGDKETFHVAFEKIRQPYFLVKTPVHVLEGTMCQHDFEGRRLFQHRNADKWNLFANNQRVEDFWYEDDCRNYILQLQGMWSGNLDHQPLFEGIRRDTTRISHPTIACGMISCEQREQMRSETLLRLKETDLSSLEMLIEMDEGIHTDPKVGQTKAALNLLKRFLEERKEDYLLFLEDDLDFNHRLLANLLAWEPLLHRRIWLGSLFNPGLIEDACDVPTRSYLVRANRMFGSQALVISRQAAARFIEHWDSVAGMQDIKMSRLIGQIGQPIWYHSPSLVQHLGRQSTWGGGYFIAADFSRDWVAAPVFHQEKPTGTASKKSVRIDSFTA